MNNLTTSDIKQSVEYGWCMWIAKICFIAYVLTVIILTVVVWITTNDVSNSKMYWDLMTLIILLVPSELIVFGIIFICKGLSLLKRYTRFTQHEVVLGEPHSSFIFRRSIYFKVYIPDGDGTISASTSPNFSGFFYTKYKLHEYSGQKVVGLLNPKSHKFYVIKKVD